MGTGGGCSGWGKSGVKGNQSYAHSVLYIIQHWDKWENILPP